MLSISAGLYCYLFVRAYTTCNLNVFVASIRHYLAKTKGSKNMTRHARPHCPKHVITAEASFVLKKHMIADKRGRCIFTRWKQHPILSYIESMNKQRTDNTARREAFVDVNKTRFAKRVGRGIFSELITSSNMFITKHRKICESSARSAETW